MDEARAARAAAAVRAQTRRGLPPVETARAAVDALKRYVAVDAWCLVTLDPATLLPTGGYHEEGLSPQRFPRLLQIEYGEEDVNLVPRLLAVPGGASTLLRATRGNPEVSTRYRDVMAPDGLAHELRALLRHDKRAWGALILFRGDDADDFDPSEVKLVAGISGDLARAIRDHLVLEDARRGEPEGPGLIVIEGDGAQATTITESARRWLSLVEDMALGPARVPASVLSVAERARYRARENDETAEARTRVRTGDGRWLSLHATALERGEGGRVAVIVEPSRPAEIASLIVDAHGLTAREREVCGLLLRGMTNKEIAAALTVSPFTVGDYVKKVFAKLGVTSRAELTSKLFFDYYLPRLESGAAPSSTGWFASPS